MANVGRREALIDGMNRVTSMTNVCLGFVDRVMSACEARHNGHAGAVEAKMPEANLAEEAKPRFCRVFRQQNERRALLFDRTLDKRSEVVMERGTVHPVPLTSECDRPGFRIDLTKGNGRFRQSAALSHGDQPTIAHPLVAGRERVFNERLLGGCDFGFLLWGRAPQSEPHGRIGRHVASPNGLLHDRRKNLQFRQSRVVRSRLHQFLRWTRPERWVLRAQLICDLRRRDDALMRQEGADGGPSLLIAKQRFFVGVFLSKKGRNPSVESIALRLLRECVLSHRLRRYGLLDLATSTVGGPTNTGGFSTPSSVRFLESNPVKRTTRSNIKRGHECSMV